jgi:hypothetical protein
MEALLLVAESGGPTMFARIGVMRALKRHHVREFNQNRSTHHWGRRKCAINDEVGKGLCQPSYMVSRNHIPGVSSQFREEQHNPCPPASEEAPVSHWRGDAVGKQRISTAQPSPQLPA